MQKAKTNPTHDGDRIYDSKQKSDFTNEKTAEAERGQQANSDNNDGREQANNGCLQDETPHGLSSDLEEFNSDDNRATLSKNSGKRSQQLDVARRILDQLDEQINSLNELQLQQQQHTRNSSKKRPICDELYGNYNNSYNLSAGFGSANNRSSNYNYYYHHSPPLADSVHGGSLRAHAIEARKLALDYYIETGIRHTGECSCHFEHNQSDEHSRLHGQQIPFQSSSSSSSVESISCDYNNENQKELNDSDCDCERENNRLFAHRTSQSLPELSAIVEPSIESTTTTTTSVERTIGETEAAPAPAAGTGENIHDPIIGGPHFGESSYSELFIENQSNDYELQRQERPTRQHYHPINESTTTTTTLAATTATRPAELVRQGLACGSSFIGGQTTTTGADAEKRSAANYSISSRGSHGKCNCSTSGGGGDSSQASRELARIEREYSKRLTGFGGRSLQNNSKQTTRQGSGALLEAPLGSGTRSCGSLELILPAASEVSYEANNADSNNRAQVQLAAPAGIRGGGGGGNALVESSAASDSCSLGCIVGEFKADLLGLAASGSSRNLNGPCNRIPASHHHYPNESRLLAVDESNCEQQAAAEAEVVSCFDPYPYASAECSLTDNSSSSLSLSWSQDFLQPYGEDNSASDEEEQAFVSGLLLGTAADIDFDEISINYLNSRQEDKDDQQNSLENFQTTTTTTPRQPERQDRNSGGRRPRSRSYSYSYSYSRCCCCCWWCSHASGAEHYSRPDKLSSRKQQRHFLDCISRDNNIKLLHYSACGTSPHEGEKLTNRASSSSGSSSGKLGRPRRYNSLTRNSISADELDSEQHSIIAASDASGRQQSQRQRRFQLQLQQRRRQESAASALADETVYSLPASFAAAAAAATSNLVVGGSKSSRSASASCCSNERIRLDFNSGKDVRASSMRAVKDIAKMSVPSLSALQYLPSQIDQFSSGQKKLSEKKDESNKVRKPSSADATVRQTPSSSSGNKMDHQRHSLKEQLQSSAKINNLKIVTESSDDVKHDESCLLHRLCMCSCVARDHTKNQNSELDEDKLTRAKAAAAAAAAAAESNEPSEWQQRKQQQRQENSSLPASSRTASFKVPKNKPTKKPNSSRSSSKSPDATGAQSETLAAGDRSDSAAAAANEQPQISDEKQSPRFLNLLRPSSALAKRSQEGSSVARKPLKGHTGDNFIRCLSLGSEGNLQSRASSSAQDDDEDDDDDDESSGMTVESGTNSNLLPTNRSSSCSLSSSSLRRPMSQPERQRADSRAAGSHEDALGGGGCCDVDLTTTTGEDAPERSKSACSSRQQDKLAAKGGFKRFLTPKRRLFASPSASGGSSSSSPKSVGLEALIQGEIESRQQTETVDGKQATKSFLSRSLTRLSQRATRFTSAASPSKTTTNKLASEQQLGPANSIDRLSCDSVRSNCVSPTISITSSESVQASLASYSSTPAPRAAAPARGHDNKCDHNRRHVSAAPEIVLNTVEYARDLSDSQSTQSYTMARLKGGSSNRAANRHYASGSTETGLGVDSDAGCGGGGGERACSLPPSPRRYRRLNHQGGPSPRLRRSPVSFRSPAALSTKIEDGLRVCSTEHFEKHIGNVKGNQEDAQKQLFKAWINHFQPNLIRGDLVDELKDGVKLIGLLAALTRDKQLRSTYERLINDKQFYANRLVTSPASRLKQLANVGLAVDYLRKRRSMKLVNLNPMDIVSGKPNVILGLCWNIILNFQLEQNWSTTASLGRQYLADRPDEFRQLNESSEISSNDVSYCTSRLSNSSTNEDSSRQRGAAAPKSTLSSSSLSSPSKRSSSSLAEEYGTNDLVAAKRRLLERVNRQFDLKLTNLTSNLLDGDVLLAIIRRLVPDIKDIDSAVEVSGKSWNKMSNEEKLDACFDIAETHLGIPRLIRGSELGRQQPPDTSTKSSLIYLSMLLNSGDSPSRSPQPAAAPSSSPALTAEPDIEQSESAKIEHYLADIDVEDKFEIGKLDSTLKKIKNLQEMMATEKSPSSEHGIQAVEPRTEEIDENLVARCRKLKEQADQIEALIAWINQADSLLEGTQKSAADLSSSIEAYRNFFSPANIPKVETSLCPTLERQYRACLGLAKQRVLSMEQTLKNWISYEEARRKLRDWLVTSETKLAQALNPGPPDQSDQRSPLAQHTSRLNDLIDYFELETVGESNYESARMTTIEQMPISLLNMEHDSVSISGSMISLGSNSSRMSILQSSKKASYNKLFDDFEFKCRLLATTLDPEQRESLLLGVKELSCRLRYITEQKVPQVVTELRMSINRCEMSIQELDESDTSAAELDEERRAAQAVSYSSDYEVRSVTDAECEATQSDSAIISDSELSHTRSPAPVFDSTSRAASVMISNRVERPGAGKATASKRNIPTVVRNASDSTIDEEEADEERGSSVQPTIAARKDKSSKRHHVAAAAAAVSTHKKSSKSRKSRKRAQAKTSTNSKSSNQKDDQHKDVETSAARRLWDKIVRTFRTNLPLNIVLLVCLAGLFAVPMMNKDACCELAQKHITTSDEFHKPV